MKSSAVVDVNDCDVEKDAAPSGSTLVTMKSSAVVDVSDCDVEKDAAGANPSLGTGVTVQAAHDALVHDRSILHSVGSIIFSAVYFGVFTAMLFTHIPTARMHKQAYAVTTALATSGGDAITPNSPIKFYNIGQLSDVFDWFSNALVPTVFVTQDQNGVDLPEEEWARIAMFNKALGGVLIEVYSKSPVECGADGSLYKLYPTCLAYEGLVTEYDSYLLETSLNATEALAGLAEWKAANWINNRTSEVMVSVLTYNGELEGYVVTELVLEFDAGGFITPKALTRPTISIPYGGKSSYANDVLVWIWWGVAVAWSISNVSEWRKSDRRPSRRDMVVQVLGLFVVEAVVGVFYAIWASIVSLLNDFDFQDSLWSLADPTALDAEGTEDDIKALDVVIDNLKEIARLTAALRVIGAVVIALIGLQILNRFRFHPQLNILTRTVASALKQFASFFVVFIVIFLTFTVIGSMIFGDRAKEFSSLDNSVASSINMLFGVFDFEAIKDLQFSIAFYWVYMVVVSLVLMNMMLAIVLDAYAQVSSDSYKQSANLALAGRVRDICWDRLCELRVPRDAILSRGKIRPRLLENVLKEKLGQCPTASLTTQTFQKFFPDAQFRYEELQATIEHLESGIRILTVMKAEETRAKED